MTLRSQWVESVRRNPLLLKDIVIAGGGVGIALGFDISALALASITAFVMAVWSPLVRNRLTPTNDPKTTVDGELVPLVPAVPDNPV